jgi:NAD(P)-dependent dehydrogenase (short-subunit alcohol dehydrogenase family)
LELTYKDFTGAGIECEFETGDISDSASNKALIKNILDKHGRLDILVLNASWQKKQNWQDISSEDFSRQVNVNMRSTLELIQGFAPAMIKNKWGRILTIGSVNQEKQHPELLVYAATKSAVMNMCQNFARQFAPHGITVNNIAPGVIDTDRNREALSDEKYLGKVKENIPLGFVGEAEDCAGAALLFCSKAGRYITGSNLYIDGGMFLK